MTNIAGIVIPSTDPVFLFIVAIHIVLGLFCVISGLAAMLAKKARGRHSFFGNLYYWGLGLLVVTASALSFMRWQYNQHLFILGSICLALAWLELASWPALAGGLKPLRPGSR